jgi:hypothetical protein
LSNETVLILSLWTLQFLATSLCEEILAIMLIQKVLVQLNLELKSILIKTWVLSSLKYWICILTVLETLSFISKKTQIIIFILNKNYAMGLSSVKIQSYSLVSSAPLRATIIGADVQVHLNQSILFQQCSQFWLILH